MLTLIFLRISAFAASCASAVSEEYIRFCSEMRSQSGFVTDFEAGYSDSESFVGLTRPIPPNLEGRANRLRSRSLGGALPVRAGIRFDLIMSSRGCSKWLMFGMVCAM